MLISVVNAKQNQNKNKKRNLSQENSDMIEGNITAVEALAALCTMKNGKSPDSEGFTAEFTKLFGMILESQTG